MQFHKTATIYDHMTPHEQDKLARIVFRHLSENVPSWRAVPIASDDPEELDRAPGHKRWRLAKFHEWGDSRYESNRKLIMDAGRYLEARGYKTASIRSPKPGYVGIRVANAGSWRLCVRIPHDIAERILILGFMPGE